MEKIIVSGTDIDKSYPIPSNFLSISPTRISIFEKANHFLPKSFSNAPKYIEIGGQRSAVSDKITEDRGQPPEDG
jgi:hypothetical protein